jgi:hypothetical protein
VDLDVESRLVAQPLRVLDFFVYRSIDTLVTWGLGSNLYCGLGQDAPQA